MERAGFTAPAACTVAVNDGSATAATATLAGCTVSAPPPSTTPSLAALTLARPPWSVAPGHRNSLVDLLGARRGRGGRAVQQQPHAATVPPSVTVPAGSTAATFTVTTNPVANPQSSIIIGTAGGATRVCHPDREDRVPGHQRQCLAGPGWDGGAGGSPPSRLHRHRDRHLRQRLFSRPAPRSGWRPVPPRARAFWAGSSRPPVGTLPRSRWPLASRTSAARYSGRSDRLSVVRRRLSRSTDVALGLPRAMTDAPGANRSDVEGGISWFVAC